MGGFFGGGSNRSSAPAVQPAKPYVAPAPAIRSEEQEKGKKKKKKMVSGEAATMLTGTEGLTTSKSSPSTKSLLGD
tara:strand:+ start:1299 stop:1526 length:228 start_codon:yes stop_codon:yes gene_type:complete